MLKIKNVTAKNFMSVGNNTQAVGFDTDSLTLVLGHNLDLGGDETYTFKELITMLLTEIKRKRLILKLPFSLARVMGATNDFFRSIFGELVPAFITLAQVKSLENDNLVGRKSDKFSDLGIIPKKLEIILPKIVARFNHG